MVVKSKLKMALVADKQVDFKKENQKKLAKKARKEKKRKVEREDEEEVEEKEVAATEQMEVDEESGDEAGPTEAEINLANIDDSDTASSSGVEDNNGLNDSDMSDNEDIPMSDLDDLPEEEKEDIIPHQRLTINNTTALTTALRRIALPLKTMTFSEHQSLTTSDPVAIPDVADDLKRELAFYSQSLEAVKEARTLLKKEKAPFSRPTDYFAEMVKADEHMARIKAKLIEEAAGKKASAEARKQRDLKKFGKQVQVAKLQERQKEKTSTLEKIKSLKRKRQDGTAPTAENEADLFDVALEDAADSKPDRKDRMGRNKRSKKDEKYGHGGKKRHAKSGDAASSGDLTGFSSRKMKGFKPSSGAAKARPGKARRAGKK